MAFKGKKNNLKVQINYFCNGTKLPVVSGKELLNALEKAGFIVVRQKGSHVSLQKVTDEGTYRTVVPLHTRLAKGTLLDILHQTGLTKEELIDLL